MEYDILFGQKIIRIFINGIGSGLFKPPNTGAIMGSVSLDQMMNMFVVEEISQPVDIQVAFTNGMNSAFWLSSGITLGAIIISVMRGTDEEAPLLFPVSF